MSLTRRLWLNFSQALLQCTGLDQIPPSITQGRCATKASCRARAQHHNRPGLPFKERKHTNLIRPAMIQALPRKRARRAKS